MLRYILSVISLFSLLMGQVHADRVAVIGGGASGLITAWLIEQNHKVTLYESENRLGGHANSIEIKVDGKTVAIDAGAEFFNEVTYPHFLRLLRYYNLPIKTYTLVTTFYDTWGNDQIILPPYHDGVVEWKSLTPYNLRRTVNFKTVLDSAHNIIQSHDTTPTLQSLVDETNVNENFKDTFLYPFLASGWGVSMEEIQQFNAYNALKYVVDSYESGSYEWYELKGGLSKYVLTVQRSLANTQIRLNTPVKQITRSNELFVITDNQGQTQEFDQVVIATNADIAGKLLKDLPETKPLVAILKKVKYFETKIAIHGDKRFMPPDQKDWRIVNVRYNGKHSAATMYKPWKSKTPVFKSWISYDVRDPNDNGNPMPENLYALIKYQHPIADQNYINAMKAVAQVQGERNLWFAGNWTGDNDSHESAIDSAIKIAEYLAPNSKRLKILRD